MHEKERKKQASQNSHHNQLPLTEQPMISHVLKKKTRGRKMSRVHSVSKVETQQEGMTHCSPVEKDGDENTSTNKTIVPSLLTAAAAAKTSCQALALDGSFLDPANTRPMSRRKDKGSTLGQTSRVPVCLAACLFLMWKDCGW
jgi:hypothetical protein